MNLVDYLGIKRTDPEENFIHLAIENNCSVDILELLLKKFPEHLTSSAESALHVAMRAGSTLEIYLP